MKEKADKWDFKWQIWTWSPQWQWHKMHLSIETEITECTFNHYPCLATPSRICFHFLSYILLKRQSTGGDRLRRIRSRRPWACKTAAYVPTSVPSSLDVWAGTAQHRPADHKNHCCRPSQVNGLTQLSLVLEGNIWVVEVLHHSVCCPGNRH